MKNWINRAFVFLKNNLIGMVIGCIGILIYQKHFPDDKICSWLNTFSTIILAVIAILVYQFATRAYVEQQIAKLKWDKKYEVFALLNDIVFALECQIKEFSEEIYVFYPNKNKENIQRFQAISKNREPNLSEVDESVIRLTNIYTNVLESTKEAHRLVRKLSILSVKKDQIKSLNQLIKDEIEEKICKEIRDITRNITMQLNTVNPSDNDLEKLNNCISKSYDKSTFEHLTLRIEKIGINVLAKYSS